MKTKDRIDPVPARGALTPVPLKLRRGMEASVHLLDRDSALAINAALTACRPLLVRGEPGVGKSQLARAAADLLERSFVHHTVNAHTETDELLFTVDLVARLAEAQIATPAERKRLELKNFVRPGPLWWAFQWETAAKRLNDYKTLVLGTEKVAAAPDSPSDNGVVVLIDEIDKADSSVPNGLLDALGHRGFEVPGHDRIALPVDAPAPLMVFTTNEERSLPDAFLRRCFVLELELPEKEPELTQALIERGSAHNKARSFGLDVAVLEAAAAQIVADRTGHQGPQRYRPGVAEYLDLLAALKGAPNPTELLGELSRFVLNKQGRSR